MRHIERMLLALLLAAVATPIQAANLIANGSFESPASDGSWGANLGGSFSYVNPTPWQVTDRAGPFRPSSLPFPSGVPDGLQVGFTGDDVFPGTLFQNVPVFLTAGATYSVSGLVGSRFDFQGSGEIVLETTLGNVLTGGSASPAPGTFSAVSFSFTPLPNDPRLGQGLRVLLQRTSGHQANFDDIRLTATPEPTSVVTAVVGLLALVNFLGTRVRRLQTRWSPMSPKIGRPG